MSKTLLLLAFSIWYNNNLIDELVLSFRVKKILERYFQGRNKFCNQFVVYQLENQQEAISEKVDDQSASWECSYQKSNQDESGTFYKV